jgi:hypothetical protein
MSMPSDPATIHTELLQDFNSETSLAAANLTGEKVSWCDKPQPLEPVFAAAGIIDPRPRIQTKPPIPVTLTDIKEDIAAIKRTASAINDLFAEATVNTYIAQGQEYKKLHGQLAKNDKADVTRIGWYAAFDKGILRHSRRQAEDLIAIRDAFIGATSPTKLPQGLRPLRLLARLLKHEQLTYSELQDHLDSKKIFPLSTEAEIRELLGLKGTRGGQTGTTAAPDTIQNLPVRILLQQLSPEQRKELIELVISEHIGSPAGIKAATEINTVLVKNRKVAQIIANAGFTSDNFRVIFQVRLN